MLQKNQFDLLKSVGKLYFYTVWEHTAWDGLSGENSTFVFGINSHALPHILDTKKETHIYLVKGEGKFIFFFISNVLKMT